MSLAVPFPPDNLFLYTYAIHSLDLEAFPIESESFEHWGTALHVHLSLDGCFATGVAQSTGKLARTHPNSGQRCPRFFCVLWPQNWGDGAVEWGSTSGNLGFSQEGCWFPTPQAGSARGAVKGRMASFPAMAVVLPDAHEISASHLLSLFPKSSLNWNFSFSVKLRSI